MSLLTPIQKFYKDTTVLLTGATGFVGKAVLEKLLRSCPDIKRIYVLIRPKKGIKSKERLEDICNSVYFDRLKRDNPSFKNCISIINGDLLLDNLGLSENDINILTNEVNIVFHLAATVKFDVKLKVAVKMNVVASKDLLEISKTIRQLKSFVYVSTAYSHCYNSELKEEFYEPMREPNELVEYVEKTNEEDLDEASIIGGYLNTYTYSKGLAEEIVRTEGKGLPICIVRPSAVMGAWAEPLPGYVENLYGPLGIMAGAGFGIAHTLFIDTSKRPDFIPVDMTANATIAAATANSKQSKDDSITIYQIVSGNENPFTWKEYFMWCNCLYPAYVSPKALWTFFMLTTKNKYAFQIYQFFLHTLPGHILDFFQKITGKDIIIIGGYLNTYTYSKGLAEEIVRTEGKGLPICIVRPSAVMGAWAEPLPGYVENLYGPLGIMAGAGFGIAHTLFIDTSKRPDFIPVDMTANATIAAATANSKQSKDDSITIYQIVSGNENPFTWKEYFMWCNCLYPAYVSPKALWTFFMLTTKNKYAFQIYQFFLHTLPGHILDFFQKITGKDIM